jgi:hypothetical protein
MKRPKKDDFLWNIYEKYLFKKITGEQAREIQSLKPGKKRRKK